MKRRTLVRRASAVAAFFCLFAALLSAQVHIREKITITPTPPPQPQALGGNGTTSLRVVFSVTKPIALRLFVTRDCGGPVNNDLPLEGTGKVVFDTSHATIGAYYFNAQTRVAEIPVGETATAVFELYTGGVLAYRSEITYTGGGTDVFAVWFPKGQFYPYAFGFSMFALNSCVRTGEYTTIALPISAYCFQDILWSPERDPITFSVTQGVGLGVLQDHNGQSLGNQVTLKWEDALNMRFSATPDLPQGGNVELQAVTGDVQRTASLTVYMDDEYALDLEAMESEVQHGEQFELVGRAIACAGTGIMPPEGTTYTFRITQGREWGRLFHEETQATGDSLAGIPQLNGVARVWFQAWEDSVTEPQVVTVELSSEGKAPVTVSFQVIPGGLQITALPPILRYGEKSTITVQKLLPDGTTEPLAPEATITYRVVGGNEAGTLQNPDSTQWGDELVFPRETIVLFSSLEETPQPDTVEVIIQIEVDEGIIIIGKANDTGQPVMKRNPGVRSETPNPALGSANSASFFFGLSGVARVKLIKERHEIMLGETKYYQAKEHPSDPTKLLIEALNAPILDGGIAAAEVWGANAVTEESGGKLGVYWEKKYPLWSGNTFAGMDELTPGLIRLVGRYWDKDSTYRVRLAASFGNKAGEIEISVIRPGRLGNSQYAIDRRFSRDVFDAPIDVDSICVYYGGLNGIPPQLIKGQMEKEARYIDNFGFSPSYRYEPYTAQFWQEVRDRRNNPFFITDSIRIPAPPDHQHVRDINYFTQAQTVWHIVREHSQLIDDVPDDPHRLYGIRRFDGTMNFGPYTTVQERYNQFLRFYQETSGLELTEASDSARSRMIVYLRDGWERGMPQNTRGLANVTAQTRIASSYGLLQPMYTIALGFGYQEDDEHLPELLNVTDTSMVVAMRFQKEKLIDRVGATAESNNNSWSDGYENGFFLGVYPPWNSNETYPAKVFRNSRNYLPEKVNQGAL